MSAQEVGIVTNHGTAASSELAEEAADFAEPPTEFLELTAWRSSKRRSSLPTGGDLEEAGGDVASSTALGKGIGRALSTSSATIEEEVVVESGDVPVVASPVAVSSLGSGD